jgi:hypothetical protein
VRKNPWQPLIELGREIGGNLEVAEQREWLPIEVLRAWHATPAPVEGRTDRCHISESPILQSHPTYRMKRLACGLGFRATLLAHKFGVPGQVGLAGPCDHEHSQPTRDPLVRGSR